MKINRRIRRSRQKAAVSRVTKQPIGKCCVDGCTTARVTVMECELCRKKGKGHVIKACAAHYQKGRGKMKAHILVRHPSTVPAAILAGLSGEDLTK